MMQENYEWVKFYSAFADKLLEYETNRKFLLEKLQNIFNCLGMKFQKLEEVHQFLRYQRMRRNP